VVRKGGLEKIGGSRLCRISIRIPNHFASSSFFMFLGMTDIKAIGKELLRGMSMLYASKEICEIVCIPHNT
jgi:hypothetical protein